MQTADGRRQTADDRKFVELRSTISATVCRLPSAVFFTAALLFLLFRAGPPGFRDGIHFHAPLFDYVHQEYSAGRLPLWCPYENLGQPLAANPIAAAFYPIRLIFVPIQNLFGITSEAAYTIYVYGHLLLAFFLTYRLAKCWGCTENGATLAAIGYAFGGNVLFQYANVPFLIGAAWFPEAMNQATKMSTQPKRIRLLLHATLLGVVLALMILGGDPQAAYHAVIVSVGLAFVLRVATKLNPGGIEVASIQDDSQQERFSYCQMKSLLTVINLLTAGIVAVALAFPQIILSVEFAEFSDRNTAAFESTAYYFSVPPLRLTEFFIPNIGGMQFPVHARWFNALFDDDIWTPSLYQGLLPILFVCFAFRRTPHVPRRYPIFAVVIALVFIVGSLGDGAWVYPIFRGLLPGYEFFRFPAKLLTVASLFLAILSGIGFDRFAETANKKRISAILAGVVLTAIVVKILSNWYFSRHLSVPACSLFGPFQYRCDILGIVGLSLIFCCLLAAVRRLPSAVLILVCFIDLLLANSWMIVVQPREFAQHQSPLVTRMFRDRSDAITPLRIYRFPSWHPREYSESAPEYRLSEMTLWERETLYPKYPLPLRISILNVPGTTQIKSYAEFHSKMRRSENMTQRLAAIGVEYVIAPGDAVLNDADKIEPEANWPSDVSLWRIRNPNRYKYILYEPNRIVFDVSLDRTEKIMIPEQYYPGWTAYSVDEHGAKRQREIVPVQKVFRGIVLESGNHRVTMQYQPPHLR